MSEYWRNRRADEIIDRYASNRGGAGDALRRHYDHHAPSALRSLIGEIRSQTGLSENEAFARASALLNPPLPKLPFSKEFPDYHNPAFPLSAEYYKQTVLMSFMFAAKLNMTGEEYLAGLPGFPEPGPGAFYKFMIVETRIHWREQAELLRIKVDDSLFNTKLTGHEPLAEKPYAAQSHIWESDPSVVLKNSGANIYEGLAFLRTQRSRALDANNHLLLFSGTRDTLGRICVLERCGKLDLYDVTGSRKNYEHNLQITRYTSSN